MSYITRGHNQITVFLVACVATWGSIGALNTEDWLHLPAALVIAWASVFLYGLIDANRYYFETHGRMGTFRIGCAFLGVYLACWASETLFPKGGQILASGFAMVVAGIYVEQTIRRGKRAKLEQEISRTSAE